jgi:hypothetical protein
MLHQMMPLHFSFKEMADGGARLAADVVLMSAISEAEWGYNGVLLQLRSAQNLRPGVCGFMEGLVFSG